MINRREKLQLFNKLRGGDHAMADISLLDDVQPNHPKLTRFSRDPKRYADEILYTLLDFCDEEEITGNRKFHEGTDDDSSDTSTESEQKLLEGSSNTSTEEEQNLSGGSSNTSAEKEKKPSDASSNTSTEEESKESSGDSPEEPSDTASDAPSDTPEGDPSPGPDAHDIAGQDEDSKKKVVQKEEEYPNIEWDNLSNEDVQMATVIYNDRINTWRKMKKLDELLDKKPKANDVAAMAELRIRNLQAFDELKAYNDTGKFLYKHPLLKGKSEFDELVKLFKKDPAEFLHKHKNTLDNIKRYKSYIKRDDRKDKRASDRENLQRHQERERMFKMVMEQYSDKSEKPDGQDG